MFISSAFPEDRSIKLNNQSDSVKSKSESNLLEFTQVKAALQVEVLFQMMVTKPHK